MHNNIETQFSLDLFENNAIQSETITLPSDTNIPNGEVIVYQDFFEKWEGDRFFVDLLHNIRWQQDKIKFFGKEVDIPRLNAWYGVTHHKTKN